MHEVGPLGPDGADHVTRQPRAHVEPAAHARCGHAELVEPLRRSAARRFRARRGRGSARRSRPRASAGSSASRWPSEPLTPVSLWRWRTFTGALAGRRPRARRPSAPVAKRVADVVGAVPAERGAQLGVARRARRGAAASAGGVADRQQEAALAVGDDGRRCRRRAWRRPAARPRATRSRRPGCPRSPTSAATRRTPRTSRGCAAGSRRSGSARRRRARARAPRLRGGRSPSPTSTSTASTPSSRTARSVRTRSSGRLIAVSRPAQPIDERRRRRAPSSARSARARFLVGRAPRRQVEAVRDDREPLGRSDPEADEVVAHLVAHGDERAGRAREHALDQPEDALPPRREVAAEHVAVVGVDDRPRPRRGPARSAAMRPVAPAFAVCVWSDVRPPLAQDRAQLADRRRVRARRQLALQRRQLAARATPSSSATYSIDSSPAASVPATTSDVVPAPLLLARELEHVQGRPADVEAGDHVHDRERLVASLGCARTSVRPRARRRA